MASKIAMPVTPLISLITLAICTFISVSTFCILWITALAAFHMFIPLPPVRPQYADLLTGTKGVVEQSIGVQLHQPLALLYVRFPPRQVLGVARIHQKNFESAFHQNFVHRQPIYACRLHSYRDDSALLQPVSYGLHILREARECSHRFGVAVWWYRHKMCRIANVNYGRQPPPAPPECASEA